MKQAIVAYLRNQTSSEALTTRIAELFEQAAQYGRDVATLQVKALQRAGALSGMRDWLGKAKDVVGRIIGRDDTMDDSDYAEMVAETEVHGVVESSKVDIYNDYGLMMLWVTEDGACDECQANAESGPLVAGNSWPSGDDAPPAHPRCRCQLSYADQ